MGCKPVRDVYTEMTRIGTVRPPTKEKANKEEVKVEMEVEAAEAKSGKVKKKMKGSGKPIKVAKKKQEGVEKGKRPLVGKNKRSRDAEKEEEDNKHE